MPSTNKPLQTLQDIKSIMERSSRFISLSGWSGVSAGICALAGAWLAAKEVEKFKEGHLATGVPYELQSGSDTLAHRLIVIAAFVFAAALISAFLFTYLRSKKENIEIWGKSAMRLAWNTILPMAAGGFVILRMLDLGYYLLVPPCCLVFYGLALVNGSKYTLGEVKFLGYGQIILGIINLWMLHYGLLFWTAGFGMLHIVYGVLMWWKYERVQM